MHRGRGSTGLAGNRSGWQGLSRAGPGWVGCCGLEQNMKVRKPREIRSRLSSAQPWLQGPGKVDRM